jgi:hypothetical protein
VKTVFYTGGSVVVDDATADAILDYSSALADRRRMDTVTLEDHAQTDVESQVVLTLGLGVPLSIRGVPTTSNETSSDIRDRLGALVSPVVGASEVDPRSDYDHDFDFLYIVKDPLNSDGVGSSS